MSGDRATIFALSSGAPPAAIAVVRVSGAMAGPALIALAGRLPTPRQATLMPLHDRSGGLLDRALCLWFPGPRTATGEDLAELHLHGGRAVVAALLAELAGQPGCRSADPGEFTRRAFANGRLDLLEAEGLADLLAAETEGERRRALHAAEGGLSRLVEGWRTELLALGARIEAQIEFGDDGDDVATDAQLGEDIAALGRRMLAALDTPPAERLRDGVRVVLCGPPNSGKSSLLNALAGRAVAITSAVPGTTRDLVEAPLVLGGVAMILVDSAGLRDTDDPIESEGVARARDAIDRADILLWLGDHEDRPDHPRGLHVLSKGDLLHRNIADDYDVRVSVVSGEGLDLLRTRIIDWARELLPSADIVSFTHAQRAALASASHALGRIDLADMLIAAEHVRIAMLAIDRLIGRTGVEEMLDALFERFCLGK